MDARAFFLLQYDVTRMMVDELALAGVSEEQMRRVSDERGQSLAWLMWHTARWEDVALTMVEERAGQVWERREWGVWPGEARRDVGVAMSAEECAAFSEGANLAALRAYRSAVEERTQEVVEGLEGAAWEELVGEGWFREVMGRGALGSPGELWLERFLMNRSRAWWLASVVWHQTARLLGEATRLRRDAGQMAAMPLLSKRG